MSQELRLSPPTVTPHTHSAHPDTNWTEAFPKQALLLCLPQKPSPLESFFFPP